MSLPSHLPADYAERVYAGVLGKIIGVYLGRPFEGWILRAHHGRARRDRLLRPRAIGRAAGRHRRRHLAAPSPSCAPCPTTATPRLDARADRPDLAQLHHRGAHDPLVGRHGQLDRAHRLSAPEAGSRRARQRLDRAERQDVAEQIGAQIFIDGWAMVAPGRPGARRRPGPARAAASATTARRSTPPR